MLITVNNNHKARNLTQDVLKKADLTRDAFLQSFVELTGRALNIPGSFISVLDDEHQYIKASCCFELNTTPRQDSFCRYAVDSDCVVVVPDTTLDPRFSSHHLTLGAPFIRFYAGASLKTLSGDVLGTLCVTDSQPHDFSSEQAETLQKLARMATHYLETWHSAGFTDAITSLPNCQALLRDIEQLASNASNAHRLILIDCLDVPRAWEMTRSLGVAVVDNLLQDLTLMLHQLLPGVENIYANATGRFALLLDDTHPLTTAAIAERIRGQRAQLTSDILVDLQMHVGETYFLPGTISTQEVYRRAVSALHNAVALGVPWQGYDGQIDQQHSDDFRLLNELALALRGGSGLYLVYQPKVDLRNSTIIGLEALIRWHHPQKGEIPPAMFLPLAEQTSLIGEITNWVIEQALQQLKTWHDQGIFLPVSINICASDLSQPDFADRLEERILQAGLPTSMLGIECLETEKINDSKAALHGMDMLKLRGFCLSLDDFGSGYSNISYLRQMPLDIIKLDRQLISGLLNDSGSRIIARSIISMLKALDYQVLAEGVEDEETAQLLLHYGCDQAQGYYFSRPFIADALQPWLEAQRPQRAG